MDKILFVCYVVLILLSFCFAIGIGGKEGVPIEEVRGTGFVVLFVILGLSLFARELDKIDNNPQINNL